MCNLKLLNHHMVPQNILKAYEQYEVAVFRWGLNLPWNVILFFHPLLPLKLNIYVQHIQYDLLQIAILSDPYSLYLQGLWACLN